MRMLKRRKARFGVKRFYSDRAKKLEATIEEIFNETVGNLPSGTPQFDAEFNIYREQVRGMENELDWIRQQPLRVSAAKAGIDIPSAFWEDMDDDPRGRRSILTAKGETWVRREGAKFNRERAKDWVAIIMPIASLIASTAIAVLGLLVALKKR